MRNFFLNNHGRSTDEKCAFNRLKRELPPSRLGLCPVLPYSGVVAGKVHW
jgi:hypothetical protein